MSTRTKKVATLMTAAIVLSSGAYALGSQAGDGGGLADAASSGSNASSTAANGSGVAFAGRRGDHRGPGGAGFRFGFDNLAQRLGVSTTALQNALKAIRDSKTPEQRRTELTQALATALGKPVDQVTAAVNSVLPDRGARKDTRKDELAAALAKALGVDVAKVQAGLDKARQDFKANGPGRNGSRDRRGAADTFVNDIAAATGVDAAKVRSALQSLRKDRPGPGDRRNRRDDIRQKLATALGVTTAQLQTAIDKVETDQRNAFATELAQKLNIDVAKVQDVLKDIPRFGRRHG
jgi:transcriptional regulator with XRE-family HTH domain